MKIVASPTDPDKVTRRLVDVRMGEESVNALESLDGSSDLIWDVNPDLISRAMGPRNFVNGLVNVTTTWDDGSQVDGYATATARRVIRSRKFNNEIVNDSTIERFRLIFFDFDRAEVNEFNQPMIELGTLTCAHKLCCSNLGSYRPHRTSGAQHEPVIASCR